MWTTNLENQMGPEGAPGVVLIAPSFLRSFLKRNGKQGKKKKNTKCPHNSFLRVYCENRVFNMVQHTGEVIPVRPPLAVFHPSIVQSFFFPFCDCLKPLDGGCDHEFTTLVCWMF